MTSRPDADVLEFDSPGGLARELQRWLKRREQRDGRSVDRNKLAGRVGVAQSTVYAWLNGESVPRRELLLSLLIDLDVPEARRWAVLDARDELAMRERRSRRRGECGQGTPESIEAKSPPVVPWLDEYLRMRTLMASGRVEETVAMARELAVAADDPFRAAQAWLFVLGGHLNLQDQSAAWAAIEAPSLALRHCREPRLLGEFHSLAAWLAHSLGALERYAMHVVSAERALTRMTEVSVAASDAWTDLAITYSVFGFHEQAKAALTRGREISALRGVSEWDAGGGMDVLVRYAVWLDHCGDTARCVQELGEAMARLPEDPKSLEIGNLHWAQFAARRLNALGVPCDIDFTDLLPERCEHRCCRDVAVLSQVCEAIAAGHGAAAIHRLDSSEIHHDTVGSPELHRLRSLAFAVAGDYRSALDASARATRAASGQLSELRTMVLNHTRAQLDQEHLRRTVTRHVDHAYADPVTGFPNRQRLDMFLQELAHLRSQAMIGAVHLGAFKSAIANECDVSANILMRRVAGIVANVIRAGQFVARCDEEHLVLVLPDITAQVAEGIGRRIAGTLQDEDWHAIIPAATTVTVDVAWVAVPAGAGFDALRHAADQAMYQAHLSGRPREAVRPVRPAPGLASLATVAPGTTPVPNTTV
ncbi:MAG: diguanylate cyclase domain-containing protein [Micromonosporaceae bacterium]